jgi:hypothetical protein
MLVAVEKDKAKELIDKYFSMLAVTGYVKHPVVVRYLVWLFLVDFVERVYPMLNDKDYNKINKALICLFSRGCCLLPYIWESRDITWGEPIYMGEFTVRKAEDDRWRIAESGEHRIVE